jgi:hypothetical protein
MKILIQTILIIATSLYFSGCTTLSRTEQTTLHELESYGVNPTKIKAKQPAVAGALNILPGAGNFYLAIGTDEHPQWTYGFLNLLTWPFSIVWGVPEAAIDASTINKKETVNYYTFDKLGKQEFIQLKTNNTYSTKPQHSPPAVVKTQNYTTTAPIPATTQTSYQKRPYKENTQNEEQRLVREIQEIRWKDKPKMLILTNRLIVLNPSNPKYQQLKKILEEQI